MLQAGNTLACSKVMPRYTLNRAQRRAAQTAKRRKERQEKRIEAYFNPLRCPRCALPFLTNPYGPRCQCQTQQKHRCTCGYDVMASQQEWRSTSLCATCADQLREQWENDEASRGEAIARYYEMRECDEGELAEILDETEPEIGATLQALAKL